MPRVRCKRCDGWVLKPSHYDPDGTCDRKNVLAKASENERAMLARGWRKVGGFTAVVLSSPVPSERVETTTTSNPRVLGGRLVLGAQLWAPAWVMDIVEAPLEPDVRRALLKAVAEDPTVLDVVMPKVAAAWAARRLGLERHRFARLADG